MTVFIIRRLLQSIAVVLVMSFIVFVGVNIVGDPVEMMVSDEADQAEREKVIKSMGLDKPWYIQYARFIGGARCANQLSKCSSVTRRQLGCAAVISALIVLPRALGAICSAASASLRAIAW